MQTSANVSMLFTDAPLCDRFERAAQAGFDAVELWWPSGEDPDDIVLAVKRAGVKVVVLNFDAGDMPAGDRGLAGDPERHGEFRANVPIALELAGRVGCTKLNALLGHERPGAGRERQFEIARESVAYAAERARAQRAEVLIEAVNTIDNGPYLVSRTAEAVSLIEDIGADNVRLQYDAFHMRRMGEDIVVAVEAEFDRIAHVQVADCPGRGEPGTGAIDFPALFGALERLGYAGHIGLEYVPSTETTEDSFAWIEALGLDRAEAERSARA